MCKIVFLEYYYHIIHYEYFDQVAKLFRKLATNSERIKELYLARSTCMKSKVNALILSIQTQRNREMLVA